MGGLSFLLRSFGVGLKGSIFDILTILFSYFIALFFRHRISRVLKYLSRQACKLVTGKFVSFSLSVLKFLFLGDGGGGDVSCFIVALFFRQDSFSGGDWIDLGDGGYLSGEGEHGGRGGGVGLGGGGGRAVTKYSIKDLSKLTQFFLFGYLADVEVHGEDEHGELRGGGAGPERGGDGLGGGVGLGGGGGLGRVSKVGGGGGYLSREDARGGGGG